MAICRRIAKIREEVAGQRGRSAFARTLGVPPSTYQNYETSRVPPADVLVRIADTAGVDLRWLLTGEAASAPSVPRDHPVLQRAAQLLSDSPDAARPLTAFLDLLSGAMAFPDSGGAPAEPPEPVGPSEPQAPAPSACDQPATDADAPQGAWIPILGRSAAGVPHFWADAEDARGVTLLTDLIDRHAARSAAARPAAMTGLTEPSDPHAQIITLAAPADNVAEFLAAPALKSRHPDAFALRIDGQSMVPDIRHGDIVVLSCAAEATDGRPAVVQLSRQIGVTCKLYRRAGDAVHLIPVNEAFRPETFPADSVVWALRVLARVRPVG
ncbi:MAG: S24 family peptidase [Planctomycetota bacterium]